MTSKELECLKELCAAATPEFKQAGPQSWTLLRHRGLQLLTHVPELIAEVERLRAERTDLVQRVCDAWKERDGLQDRLETLCCRTHPCPECKKDKESL
jgi:hypothetical protein